MIVIYGTSISPYVRKALVFAIEKGIAFEPRPGGPRAADPDFARASPFGKIPALTDGEFGLADSSAIVTYLEALAPEPNLIPVEPRARARTVWFDEFGDTIAWGCGGKIAFARLVGPRFMGVQTDLAAADEAQRTEFPKLMDYLESVAPAASGYLVEDRFTLADIAVASPLATLMLGDCRMDANTHPRAHAYVSRIWERPSFATLMAQEKAMMAA